jgi:hypothetical protein
MNTKYNNDIRVFTELKAFKESSYFYISFKDRLSKVVKVVGSKQVFFQASSDKTCFPVLKSCRILRRLEDTSSDNNTSSDNTRPIKEHMMDPSAKMMITTPTDGNQDTIPNNNESTPSATADDDVDDDATVQTNNSNSTKQAWTSYNIKLLLSSKRDTSDSALQHAMLTILTAIDQELGADTKIFDGKNNK